MKHSPWGQSTSVLYLVICLFTLLKSITIHDTFFICLYCVSIIFFSHENSVDQNQIHHQNQPLIHHSLQSLTNGFIDHTFDSGLPKYPHSPLPPPTSRKVRFSSHKRSGSTVLNRTVQRFLLGLDGSSGVTQTTHYSDLSDRPVFVYFPEIRNNLKSLKPGTRNPWL